MIKLILIVASISTLNALFCDNCKIRSNRDSEVQAICVAQVREYQSRCFAICNGENLRRGFRFKNYTEGHCDRNACPDTYQPVCGVDNQTYDNSCKLKAAGIELHSAGKCDSVCDDNIVEPLCSFDNVTYQNRQVAQFFGADIRYLNECEYPKDVLTVQNCVANGSDNMHAHYFMHDHDNQNLGHSHNHHGTRSKVLYNGIYYSEEHSEED